MSCSIMHVQELGVFEIRVGQGLSVPFSQAAITSKAMAEALLSTHTPSYAFTASKAVITEAEMQFIVSLNYCGTASAGPVTIH